jgi:exodeoxyribonuclease VII small subunit
VSRYARAAPLSTLPALTRKLSSPPRPCRLRHPDEDPGVTPKKQAPAAETQAVDLEAALAELEQLVVRMERGDLPLEEALASFERGVELTRACQQALQQAELKVQVLVERAGKAALEPLDADR